MQVILTRTIKSFLRKWQIGHRPKCVLETGRQTDRPFWNNERVKKMQTDRENMDNWNGKVALRKSEKVRERGDG